MNYLARIPAEKGWRAVVAYLRPEQSPEYKPHPTKKGLQYREKTIAVATVEAWGLVQHFSFGAFGIGPAFAAGLVPIGEGFNPDAPGFEVLQLVPPDNTESDDLILIQLA